MEIARLCRTSLTSIEGPHSRAKPAMPRVLSASIEPTAHCPILQFFNCSSTGPRAATRSSMMLRRTLYLASVLIH